MVTDNTWSPQCPMCNSKRSNEDIHLDQDVIVINKECTYCAAMWTDVYTFSHVELNGGPPEVLEDEDLLFI